jgi:uncharacterized membrane protein
MPKSKPMLLALATLCLSSRLLFAQPADITCTGTEPFWKLEIWKEELYFQDGNKLSGHSELELKEVKLRSVLGAERDAVRIYETKTSGKRGIPVTVILQKREETKCSTSLSDPSFPYDAIVITPRAVFTGCCK